MGLRDTRGRAAQLRGEKNAAHQRTVRAWIGKRPDPAVFTAEILPGLGALCGLAHESAAFRSKREPRLDGRALSRDLRFCTGTPDQSMTRQFSSSTDWMPLALSMFACAAEASPSFTACIPALSALLWSFARLSHMAVS